MQVSSRKKTATAVAHCKRGEWKALGNNRTQNCKHFAGIYAIQQSIVKTLPKGHSVADISGGERRVQCCKDLYSIGTWNVRSMNQGKLDVVKQGMTRLNMDILGISELKWTGMGEFNSDDHQVYYCGQESLRRNGVAFLLFY
uniref:Uncharacterized protein n=1 Tax=Varanus komodoensis TaxID=61221 RepID=A0A8D2Q8R7_VARKO